MTRRCQAPFWRAVPPAPRAVFHSPRDRETPASPRGASELPPDLRRDDLAAAAGLSGGSVVRLPPVDRVAGVDAPAGSVRSEAEAQRAGARDLLVLHGQLVV